MVEDRDGIPPLTYEYRRLPLPSWPVKVMEAVAFDKDGRLLPISPKTAPRAPIAFSGHILEISEGSQTMLIAFEANNVPPGVS